MKTSRSFTLMLVAVALSCTDSALAGDRLQAQRDWENRCADKILHNYQGPALEKLRANVPVFIECTIYRDGSVRWPHRVLIENGLVQRTCDSRDNEAVKATEQAVLKSSPLEKLPLTHADDRAVGGVFLDPKPPRLRFWLTDATGLPWSFPTNEKSMGNDFAPMLAKVAKNFPSQHPKQKQYAAVWFIANPDGQIDKLTRVDCSTHGKRQTPSESAKKTETLLLEAVKKSAPNAPPKNKYSEEQPLGVTLVYRSDRKPELKIYPGDYGHRPDVVNVDK